MVSVHVIIVDRIYTPAAFKMKVHTFLMNVHILKDCGEDAAVVFVLDQGPLEPL